MSDLNFGKFYKQDLGIDLFIEFSIEISMGISIETSTVVCLFSAMCLLAMCFSDV